MGYTYNLTGCTQDDIEGVIYRGEVGGVFVKLLEAGDTVVLPAGSATWGDGARANAGKIYFQNGYAAGGAAVPYTNVTFRGQGDSTVITMHENGAVYAQGVINLGADGLVFRDMKIKGAGDRPVTAIIVSGSGCRISNITYEGQPDLVSNNGQDGTGYFVFQQGVTGTLIDHCRISAALGNHEWIFTRGPTNAWQSNSVVGTSQQDLFVEDCTFTNVGYSDANANGRHVFRFNTITGNIKFDAHGLASNTPARSFRSVEYYNNTWTYGAMAAAMEIRGGTSMVFNNTAASGHLILTDYTATAVWPNSASVWYGQGNIVVTQARTGVCNVQTPVDHPFLTGMAVVISPFGGGTITGGDYICTRIDARNFEVPLTLTGGTELVQMLSLYKTPYDWPLPDQVGNGKDGAAREPAYLWGNTRGGSSWPRTLQATPAGGITTYRIQTSNPAATYTERDIIAPNRDFFASAGFDTATGVSVGTRAAMDAYTPTVTGYGWWVTDEGSWNTKLPANTSGRLYKWNGSAWTLFYTPYTYPHPLQTATECGQPEPSVASGTYEYDQSITLQAIPVDATLRYTLDGSTPTSTHGTVYTGTPISVGLGTTTLKAIAYKSGLTDSPVNTLAYTVTHQVVAPTSNKVSGDFHGDQSVTLSCSTAGASIFYTLDGSTPTAGSTPYTGAFTVTSSTSVKAIAIKSGLTNSTVLTIDINILLEVGNWEELGSTYSTLGYFTGYAYFTASVTGALTQVSIKSTNTNPDLGITWALYRDTSGDDTGNLSLVGSAAVFSSVGTWTTSWKHFAVNFPVTAGQKYRIFMQPSDDVSLSAPATYNYVRMSWRTGRSSAEYANAVPSTITYSTNVDGWTTNVKGTLTDLNTVSQPSFSLSAGAYTGAQTVELSTSTSGASIFYTVDGTQPTAGSTAYTGPITVGATQTVKAIGIKAGMTNSVISSASYTITPAVAAPTFTPAAGTYPVPQTVGVSTTTAGATLYYTVDGTTPTTSSPVVTGPIYVPVDSTIKVLGVKAGIANSNVASAQYLIHEIPAAIVCDTVTISTITVG